MVNIYNYLLANLDFSKLKQIMDEIVNPLMPKKYFCTST